MISDPVRGLARRHGSVTQAEKVIAADTGTTYADMVAATAKQKTFTFFIAGVEYELIYRSEAGTGAATFAFCYNKTTKAIVPVVLGADMASYVSAGIASCVNVGKYVFLAGNGVVSTYSETATWAAEANRKRMAIWVRGGAYSRTYEATLIKPDGTKLSVEYKTKSSSYPTLLDTSDILAADTEYQKKVNDRVYAYNAAANAWIGEAAEDITPANIATKLKDLFVAAGVTGITVSGSTILIDNALYNEVGTDDGGDGSSIRGVGGIVSLPENVSNTHYIGKIVKVRPKKSNEDDTIYLKAVAKEAGATGWADVTWVECAGLETMPTAAFAVGTVVSGTLYIAGTPSALATVSGDDTPMFRANEVGDANTSGPPHFLGKAISYLGLLQDRLIIGSGSVLFFSKPGDYFAWYRGSVLSTSQDDPLEMYALGSEDDTIRYGTTYDKSLLLFGDRKLYSVNGRAALTPQSLVVLSSREGAAECHPKPSGDYVFFTVSNAKRTSVQQIQTGLLADTPQNFDVSQQLDRYLQGKPVEIVAVSTPNHVVLRTDHSRNSLFTYTYLDDANSQRLFDAWSTWRWHERVGDIIGLSSYQGDLLVYVLRHGADKNGDAKIWLAVEKFSLDTGLTDYIHADALRTVEDYYFPTDNSFMHEGTSDKDQAWVAWVEGDKRFLGTTLDKIDSFVEQYPLGGNTATYIGWHFDAYATPTNPYIRDSDGKAIVNGRTTLSRVIVSVADTGGMKINVNTANESYTTTDFSGRLLGRVANVVGRQPIVTTAVSGLIGKEVREVNYTLQAKTFLPLTITAIEWVGQYFNNVQRV